MSFTTIFFDLDDTLYPASSGLWQTLKDRMSAYMRERMGIPQAEIGRLREKYFHEYGTTLRGLQANHKIDAQDFLAYVHDIPLADYIHPDPVQQQVLASLRTRNLIFTNSDVPHAQRVLRQLQIEEYFADIIDINRMSPFCKPNPEAFALALKVAGESEPSRCVMIDDLPHTTRAAKAQGLYTLLFGVSASGDVLPAPVPQAQVSASKDADADAALSDWSALPALLHGRSK